MKKALLFGALALLLVTREATAQDTPKEPEKCSEGTCVPKEDLANFVRIAKERACQLKNKPILKLDPITIIVDRDGRIFSSGSAPSPYHVTMTWCIDQFEGVGQVEVFAAKQEESTYGFRFKVKAGLGYLPLKALDQKDGYAGFDAGVLLDWFYFLKILNVNAYVGYRSFGIGAGVDILKNLGVVAGYNLTWEMSPKSNLFGALSFALW